jgi:uncharacterized membrane protein YgcG
MSAAAEPRLGLSGTIAKKFLLSEITPLLALVGLLMGMFAVLVTPREEEPQINVTFANVFIPVSRRNRSGSGKAGQHSGRAEAGGNRGD